MLLWYMVACVMTIWRIEALMMKMRMLLLLLILYILILTMDPVVMAVNGTMVAGGQLSVWTWGYVVLFVSMCVLASDGCLIVMALGGRALLSVRKIGIDG
jgi:hypothetical protein